MGDARDDLMQAQIDALRALTQALTTFVAIAERIQQNVATIPTTAAYHEQIAREHDQQILQTDARQLLAPGFKDPQLRTRTFNCFFRANIKTVADLMQHSERELMKLKNFGRKSLTELEAALAEHGLKLNGAA